MVNKGRGFDKGLRGNGFNPWWSPTYQFNILRVSLHLNIAGSGGLSCDTSLGDV